MKHTSLAALTAIVWSICSAPAHADLNQEDKQAIAGALVLLGAAALAHNQNHYREGYAPEGAAQTADFERGYRDGLHAAGYDSARSSADYGQGYDAGNAERQNRLAHRTVAENKVPHSALSGCAAIAARNAGVGMHDVHITRTVYRGANDYLVETAVGHTYLSCAMTDAPDPSDVFGGRLQ